jgi:2-polyprenyl-3-methyl-5-hydroxy-6-metoxy-1,4-benzoquinol methylase
MELSCRLCAARDVKLLTTEVRNGVSYRVGDCLSCGVVQALDVPHAYSPDYVDLAENEIESDRLWCQGEHKLKAYAQWERVLRRLGAPVRGARLLDVGCGTGGFLDYVRSVGAFGAGFDASAAQVQAAQARGLDVRHSVSPARYRSDTAEASGFDVVTLWDVFEHLREPKAFLEELTGLMRPGALLYISVPNGGALQWKRTVWEAAGRTFSYEPWEHVFYYRPKSLARYLNAWGLDCVEVGSVVAYERKPSPGEYVRRGAFWLTGAVPAINPQIYAVARRR